MNVAQELVPIAKDLLGGSSMAADDRPWTDYSGREIPPIPKVLYDRVHRKVKRLNDVTDGKFNFSFGYIGNLIGGRRIDDRLWMLFHRNDLKSIAKSKSAETANFVKLAKWILSLPEDEDRLVKGLRFRGHFYEDGQNYDFD